MTKHTLLHPISSFTASLL